MLMSRSGRSTSQPTSRAPESDAAATQAVMTGFIGWLDTREIPADQSASIQRAGSGFLRWAIQRHPDSHPFYLQTQIELRAWDYWGWMRARQALSNDLTDAGRALGWLWLYTQATHGHHTPAIAARDTRPAT